MKVNNKCVKSMCAFVGALILFITTTSCMQESAYSRLVTEDYPNLYTHVFNRDADSILTFTDHPKEHIREQAWRALISTPVENMDEFITKVQYANIEEGWMALSAHELNESQLTRLHDLWKNRSTMRKGISTVLGKQGNQASLDMLTQNFNEIIGEDSDYEYEAALAMGRLMVNFEMGETTKRSILRYAAVLEEEDLYRAYFYGLYRSGQALEDAEMLNSVWGAYEWVESPEIRQYALSISFNKDAEWTFNRLPVTDISTMNVQLAVELARHTNKVNWGEKLEDVYSKLLEHQNPVVNEVALTQIQNHPNKPASFDEVIVSLVVENQQKESSVRLSGIQALSDKLPYLALTDFHSKGNEYLLIKKLDIYQSESNPDEYLEMLEGYFAGSNRMEALFAVQALPGWWGELDDAEKTSTRKEKLRTMIFNLLEKGDRSITYSTVSFLQSADLLQNADYTRIEELLTQYELPADIEVYQVFGGLLYNLFEDQAEALIDSLANEGNFALNNTLSNQGWDIPEIEAEQLSFKTPDWERLGELEYEPIWVLETGKGVIRIAMDVLSAPATISGIDSLTQAGAYDSVAFHRVVPNFVIQGGDIETGDGFGGPDYVVPTEASAKEYRRGMVGIASAGTDTEGSQYFVMHQWKPHLNGSYTIIGEVVEGMDVVDRMMVGDKVLKAYWQRN
jgi:cyclophilin family peptidyl-prolyl cis-trans isomerase